MDVGPGEASGVAEDLGHHRVDRLRMGGQPWPDGGEPLGHQPAAVEEPPGLHERIEVDLHELGPEGLEARQRFPVRLLEPVVAEEFPLVAPGDAHP